MKYLSLEGLSYLVQQLKSFFIIKPDSGKEGQILSKTADGVKWVDDKDTVTTINGKTGAITKEDIVALGLPAKDTTYTAGTNVTITGTTISAKDTIYDDTELKTRITAVENREDKDTTYNVATTTENGLMSSADKSKLDGIESNAQKNTVASVNGKKGAVSISKSDVGLGSVENIGLRALTQTQYDALSQTEKDRSDVWYGIYK